MESKLPMLTFDHCVVRCTLFLVAAVWFWDPYPKGSHKEPSMPGRTLDGRTEDHDDETGGKRKKMTPATGRTTDGRTAWHVIQIHI